MKLAQLKALIKRGESETLEFKTSTSSISAGMQTVCAFLNSNKGGSVIFGVKDDGKLVGQEVTDKTLKDIAAELNKIEPYVKIDVNYVRVTGNRQAIVFLIKPGEQAPYTYDGRSFMRNQSTTMRMPKEEYTYLYNKNNPALWESLINKTCTIKDLDLDRIKEIVRMGNFEKRLPGVAISDSIPTILKNLGLMVEDKLTNAAVILFCKDEQKQFMQCNVQLARFRGTTKSEFLNNKKYRANAFDLYDKAMDFLVFSLPVAARIVSGKASRVETPAIPYTVLREALINALVHRDYSNPGASVSIAIYDDRVNITNIGSLPKGVEISKLAKEHQSIQRNPIIANAFYLCGKIEGWGRGTLDMIKDSQAAGNPLPEYEEIGGSFSVTLPLKEPMPTIIYEQREESHALTTRQKAILKLLRQGDLTAKDLIEKIDVTLVPRTMQKELAKLDSLGLISPADKGKGRTIIWRLVKVKAN